MFVFNLLPLVLVLAGVWRVFDVMAFYWAELIAIGGNTVLKMMVTAIYDFYHRKYGHAAGEVAGMFFFLLHFGFFIVMTCFLVGSFLPPDTPARALDSVFVPMIVVMENMPFAQMIAIACGWQLICFFTDFLLPRGYETADETGFILRAYGSLAALFLSGFAGVAVMMTGGARIWGAVILTALKTLMAFFETRHLLAKQDAADKAI